MIEVYIQNHKGTYFAIALQQQEIVASTFSGDQKTALENILCNLPFKVPFQVFHEPSPQAKTILQTLKDIFTFSDKASASLHQKSPQSHPSHPRRLRYQLRRNSEGSRRRRKSSRQRHGM